jgi:lipopolysaccharide biosynthesis glycosyltransferase
MKTNIVFFSDRNMLPGLHAALVSLMKSFEGEQTQVVIFCDNLDEKEKGKITDTWNRNYTTNLSLSLRDMPEIVLPEGTDTLHGNITTYGRLFLGQWLDDEVEKVVYLDSDLIVQYNVQNIANSITDDYTLYVDGYGKRLYSWDNDLYESAGLSLEGLCFNAGVLGINLNRWRKNNYLEKCFDVMRKYQGNLKSADQSVLNIVCAEDFYSLGNDINFQLQANTVYNDYNKQKIYHFVGSPKPFDFLAKHIHKHYSLWNKYFKKTSIKNVSLFRYTTLQRIYNIRRSYIREIIKK